ncbi:MAG: cell envelope integrity protein TolA [Pseudomonadota bacterium]
MITAPRFQHVSSGGLAVVVHGLFLLALVLSMSWKSLPHLPVEADLWVDLPAPAPEMPEPELSAPPLPEPESAPAPPQAQLPSEADIALRKAEEEKLRQAEELKREEAARMKAEADARQAEEEAAERVRQEQEAREQAEQKRLEEIKQALKRRQLEQDMARQARADLEAEEAQVRVLQVREAQRAKVVADYRQRIQAKVLSYVRLPPRISGNPEAVFQVSLFANGEVKSVKLVKSSGQPAYDEEVERAILKASPLPLPAERESAAAFRDGITMKFRPHPDGLPGRR